MHKGVAVWRGGFTNLQNVDSSKLNNAWLNDI